MYIQVRTIDAKQSESINISKLTRVSELKTKIHGCMKINPEKQRLFYRGKQLEDDYKLFDYDVRLNDVIQVMIKPDTCGEPSSKAGSSEEKENTEQKPSTSQDEEQEKTDAGDSESETVTEGVQASLYYKVGDLVDAKDPVTGAWFEAKVLRILKDSSVSELPTTSDSKSSSDHVLNDTSNLPSCSKTKDPTFRENSPTKKKKNRLSLSSGSVSPRKSSRNSNALSDELESSIPGAGETVNDGYTYNVQFESYESDGEIILKTCHLRPRAHYTYKFDELKVEDTVLVNYNIDKPGDRGYWYDMKISSINNSRTSKSIVGTLIVGQDNAAIENCKVNFWNEVMRIEMPKLLKDRTEDDDLKMKETSVSRSKVPDCSYCKDIPTRKCRNCSCYVCGSKEEPEKQILCDDCDMAYHLGCLTPPLESLPDEDYWYCPSCKTDENEIVGAGAKLKESKKKARLTSANSNVTRDWGKGMACVGRSKVCTLVPSNHYGPVPGIDVGTCWKFRLQVSEAGVHRPHVAGIHGRESDGAYSIVLSGGYEDDTDNGDEFYYTGSGGRDLSGNKRTANQSSDQVLTRMNKALALNCDAPLDAKNGSEAKDWKKGKPVRVVRNYKLKKHSPYAPDEGNRYDGIYKVVKYWPEKGKSGFIVWRYLLRRDDAAAAPWTPAGKKRIQKLGLDMVQYPEGYEEAMSKLEGGEEKGEKTSGKRAKEASDDSTPDTKRRKVPPYDLDKELLDLINKDSNDKLWAECKNLLKDGKQKFLAKVTESFECICCQELVSEPITPACHHNSCKKCLKRSFAAEIYNCPYCRMELGKDYKMEVNSVLGDILKQLFPGYDAGR